MQLQHRELSQINQLNKIYQTHRDRTCNNNTNKKNKLVCQWVMDANSKLTCQWQLLE
jgi:hypothetical protein